jgi:hypothetical protein
LKIRAYEKKKDNREQGGGHKVLVRNCNLYPFFIFLCKCCKQLPASLPPCPFCKPAKLKDLRYLPLWGATP